MMKHTTLQKNRGRRPAPQAALQPQREVPAIRVDPNRGLTAAQVRERQENGWANTPVEASTRTVGQIVKENVFTFFNLIFVILAVLLIAVGALDDLVFLLIAAANTGIGILQQLRSKATMDKLNLLAAPRADVVREGNLISVPSAQLVRDDIAVLSAGDQIPADAVVAAGSLQVNESLITGEADAIEKREGDALMSGSFVVAGQCRAQLTKVGAASYAARLTLEAKKDVKAGKSEMMASLDKLIRLIGILLIPVGILLFLQQYKVLELGIQQSVVAMVAALLGMIPEGLYLLTSVALAVSVLRLARGKVLAQDMSCIETLARVDVLCVDKTGTITEPKMEVGEVVLLNEARFPEAEITAALNAFYQAVDADNDTARAMKARFHGPSVWRAAKVVPFTSAAKWSAAVFSGRGAYVVGAPEFVLGARYQELRERVEPYSAKGFRVLLAAAYDGTPDSKLPLQAGALSPMALILLSNRIRPEAPKTFRYFAEQGVTVKVISGDNPVTVSEVARQAGIKGAEKYVDAATLTSDHAIERAAREYTVFGRVTPNQKRKLVRALQRAGHTVAMTGDGVNDVLALKDANCGIAMASGSDAACRAAHLVLLNSDFSAMPKVVAEGRRVINNIERAASLFLVKNIFSFLLAVISLFATFPYPLKPAQLTLISAFTIGIPSFFLALEPNHSLVRGSFLPNVLRRAFPGGLSNLTVILLAELFTMAFAFSVDELSTMSAILMLAVGLLVLYQACRPFDWKRRAIWGSMVAVSLIAVIFFHDTFSLTPLTFQSGLVLAVLLALSYSVVGFLSLLFHWGDALVGAGRRVRSRRR